MKSSLKYRSDFPWVMERNAKGIEGVTSTVW